MPTSDSFPQPRNNSNLQRLASIQGATDVPIQPVSVENSNFNARIDKKSETADNGTVIVRGKRNSLSNYTSSTYKFKFFMASSIASQNMAFSKTNTVVIAETGKTSRFNITDVDIENFIGPDEVNRNTVFSSINMNINEVFGCQFIDALQNTGYALGIENFHKAPYFLELSFIGYNENGNPVEIEGTKRLWKIAIKNIEMDLDPNGSTYSLSLIGYQDQAFTDRYELLDRMIRVESGNTVSSFFTSLQNSINSLYDEHVGIDRIIPDKVNIFVSQDIATIPLKANPNSDPSRNNDNIFWEPSKSVVTIQPGTAMSSIVDFMMVSCEANATNILQTSQEQINTTIKDPKKKASIIWSIEAEVQFGKYDPRMQDYARVINYFIKPYTSHKPTDGVLTAAAYDRRDVQTAIIPSLDIQKVYNYFYTGKNDSVLDFNMNLNTMWWASLPLYAGIPTANTVESMQVNKNATEQSAYQQAIISANRATERYQSELSRLERLQRTQDNPTTSSRIDFETERTRHEVERLREEARTSARRVEELTPTQVEGGTDLGFSEKSINQSYSRHHPVTSIATGNMPESGILNNTVTTRKPFSSIAAGILNQIYGSSGDLIHIELGIIGDPYWLGPGEYERINRLVTQFPAYSRINKSNVQPDRSGEDYIKANTDNMIALRFYTPKEADNDTGIADFTESDLVSGVYGVVKISSTFSNGQFRQTLYAFRDVLINPKYISFKENN